MVGACAMHNEPDGKDKLGLNAYIALVAFVFMIYGYMFYMYL